MRGSTVSPIVCALLLTLSVASPALADLALFRVEQRWHDFPDAPVTSPGRAGMYQRYIQPYTYYSNPAVATVQPGNPVGGAFTLPTGFINFTGTYSHTPKIGWPGYTTITYKSYYNGPGKFAPSNGSTTPVRLYFPTTGGNPLPTYNGTQMKWTGGNYGFGSPLTPTTTFYGRYENSRAGSINVTPGPSRFGGTFRMFYGPNAGLYKYVYYFTPALYKAYGIYTCRDDGNVPCTPSTFVSTAGDVTQIYVFYHYLLNITGTGTGNQTKAATAKATTPTTVNGRWVTPNGNASYIVGVQRYLNHIHPWTTGYAKVHNPTRAGWRGTTPQATGYDYKPASYVPTLTVTLISVYSYWNSTLSSSSTRMITVKQYLYNVGRIVSMVRPRLIHTYRVPVDESGMIRLHWNVASMWRLKVFFLPEPAGMLLLGAGLGCMVVLYRVRRQTGTDR